VESLNPDLKAERFRDNNAAFTCSSILFFNVLPACYATSGCRNPLRFHYRILYIITPPEINNFCNRSAF